MRRHGINPCRRILRFGGSYGVFEMCAQCEKCGSVDKVDVYNDFDDEPGVLICDACIYAEAFEGSVSVVMPERPEGYYHLPIDTFS